MTYKYDVIVFKKNQPFEMYSSNSRNARKHLFETNADKVLVCTSGFGMVISYAGIDPDTNILVYGASKRE